MMFKNTSFENKWWYAFIDEVTYINDNVTELHYTIDVIQSWLTVFYLMECFIERQHSETDAIGDNITPEDFDAGEYVYNNYDTVDDSFPPSPSGNTENLNLTDMCVMIAVCDINEQSVDGAFYDGIYGGATLYCFPCRPTYIPSGTDLDSRTDEQKINEFLSHYSYKPDSILNYCLRI